MGSESGNAGTGPLRVLVAEDQAIIRLDLCGVLEQYGLIVCAEARDGEEAVELARTARPDVALLDVRMPKLDGIEAARRIYAERPIPIVMLTAFSDRAEPAERCQARCASQAPAALGACRHRSVPRVPGSALAVPGTASQGFAGSTTAAEARWS